jgi:hypothetical protein
LESTGIGTVEGTVKSLDGRFVPIKFTDVLLVPDLGANLLSVKKLVAKGAKVIFAEVCSYIEVNGNTRLPMHLSGGSV